MKNKHKEYFIVFLLIFIIVFVLLTLYLEKKGVTKENEKLLVEPISQPIYSTPTEPVIGQEKPIMTQKNIDPSFRAEVEHLLSEIHGRGPSDVVERFGTSAVPVLLEIMRPDYTPNYPGLKDPYITHIRTHIRSGAIQALGIIRDERAVEPLINALRTKTENLVIREEAVFALGQIGTPEAFEQVLNALSDEHYGVREAAVITLGRMKDKRALPALEEAYKRESEDFIKKRILKAIEEIREADK